MKQLLRLLLLLPAALGATLLPAAAQTLSVRGTALDDKTGEALPFISAQLLTADSTLYAVALTDDKGRFNVETDSAATYRLRLSGVGFDTYTRRVSLTAGKPVADVGTVRLKPNAIRLGEATATGKATNLTIRKDTFVYSAKTMLLDAGSTLSAMISQMPGVTMDDEGNLVWQGKKVESLLVNGRRFFGGDIATALRNLPAEMVENLKLYDKKSDMTERTGVDDGERTTVIDVGIKKEYQGTWQGNLDAGGGHKEKWTGRAFISRFSDRLQVGLSGLANNLNGDARVDRNGNWYNSGWRAGWSTLRGAALSVGWNSKDKKDAPGYQELNASVNFDHDNTDLRRDQWQENFLPGQDAVWWNSRSRSASMNERLSGDIYYTLNIDTLNFLNVQAYVNKTRRRTDYHAASATMNADPADHFDGNPLDYVMGDDLPPETQALLVNTMDERSHTRTNSHYVSAKAEYSHKFRGTQHMLSISTYGYYTRGTGDEGIFYDGRYYEGGLRHEPNRQFNPSRSSRSKTESYVSYRHSLGHQLWWITTYNFSFNKETGDQEYYRLESLPGWTDLKLHPVSQRPERLAELAHLLNDNTRYVTEMERNHYFNTSLSGSPGQFEVSAMLPFIWQDQTLWYDRPDVLTTRRSRGRLQMYPQARLKYKFNDRTSLQGSYSGSNSAPSLLSLLPVTDDNNPQGSSEGNPDLKDSWTNSYGLNFNTFFEPQQLSLYAYAGAGNTRRATTKVMEYNEATGYYHTRTVNVDGNWNIYGGTGITLTLDREKRWNMNASFGGTHSTSHGYLTLGSGPVQLNTVRYHSQNAILGLSYRRDKLFASVSAQVMPEQTLSSLQPESNERGITFNYDVDLSYTTPWGMSLGTDFMVYSRRRYLIDNYNTDQLIWNAHISQDFLKDKNLTLKLEATDILAGQTSDVHSTSAYANYTTRMNSFERFVVLHVIYKFTIGKKQG